MRYLAICISALALAGCGPDSRPDPTDDPDTNNCTSDCREADTQCGAGGVQTCIKQPDGCFRWSGATGCPSGQACETGICVCVDECTANACTASGLRTCETASDGCMRLSPAVACPSGQSCSASVGACTCKNECTTGTCTEAGLRTCDTDTNGCRRLSSPAACSAGLICLEGECTGCEEHLECEETEVCVSTRCREAAGRDYEVTLYDVTVPTTESTGSAWDPGGGAPDPYAVLYADGAEVCRTAAGSDTFTATWNKTCTVTLRSNTILIIRIFDEDLSSHDEIDAVQFSKPLLSARYGGSFGELYPGSRTSMSVFIDPL